MIKKVLITGGTGLIGNRITDLLLEKGYQVAHVSRSKKPGKSPETFVWDLKENYLDPAALKDVDAIIHLAGAGRVRFDLVHPVKPGTVDRGAAGRGDTAEKVPVAATRLYQQNG